MEAIDEKEMKSNCFGFDINAVGLCCLSSNNKNTLPNLRQFLLCTHFHLVTEQRQLRRSCIISFMHFWNEKYGNFVFHCVQCSGHNQRITIRASYNANMILADCEIASKLLRNARNNGIYSFWNIFFLLPNT